jgi:hypothetical protein
LLPFFFGIVVIVPAQGQTEEILKIQNYTMFFDEKFAI